MEGIKKYAFIAVCVLMVLAFISTGIFGYMWGKQSSANKVLKDEKREYLRVKLEQDSIIDAANKKIFVLTDSIEYLVADGVSINNHAEVNHKTNVNKEKQNLTKDINAVPGLDAREQAKLFAKQSDEYKPPVR